MTISLAGPLSSGVAAGDDGSATNNATSTAVLSGVVRGVYIDYKDSPPAGTTDVTVATAGTNASAEIIHYKANSATSGWFYPKTLFNLNTTGAATTALYEFISIHDKVKITIAGADAADYVLVYILLEN